MPNLYLKLLLLVNVVFISSTAFALSHQEARHLLTRTGFSATHEEILSYTKLSHENAVAQILDQVNTNYQFEPPAWLLETPKFERRKMKNASQKEKQEFRRALKMKELELKAWLIAEMVNTDSPFTEKMVLFWHNHFTSSLKKVKQPILLFNQNQLFREHALGNFRQMTHAISKDPAMLGYLDNFKSTKKSPNENFARELLELFTLGEGNYTENDIKEAARAFTGWSIDRKTGRFKYRKPRHDFGKKEFLGQYGKFNGDDIIEIIFQQPEVATLIVNKLWREFISEKPDSAEVHRLAEIFRENNYELRPLIFELLTSDAFVDKNIHAQLIKSPIDYIVGTLRLLDIPVKDGRGAAFASAHLGQNLFDPPNVKGWVGGTDWITSSSLLTRQQLLERMFRGEDGEMTKLDNRKNRMFGKNKPKVDLRPFLERFSKRHSNQEILNLVLADAPVNSNLLHKSSRFSLDDIIALMSDPVYQLK